MKLPKVESLIIIVFFLCIGLWAISKCGARRAQFSRDNPPEEKEERPVKRDTVYVPQPQASPQTQPQTYSNPGGGVPQLQTAPSPAPAQPAPAPGTRPTLSNTTQAAPPPATTASPKYSTLFVTIDGLKMRKEPGLKSTLVTKLDLYEQVYFLNKKSEKMEEINLGLETVTDYWVKVRTKSGKEGWVFGAGVHYYKMKRKGVLE